MTKVELRAEMRRRRAALDPAALERAGDAVAARILALPELAWPVLCYLSVRREVPTRGLVAELARRGVVAVPNCVDPEAMEARLLAEPLVPGVLGIPTSDGPLVPDVRVAICPGLAFDRRGARLGYGGGYYDRWLAAHPDVLAIGVCHEDALVDELPTDPHDRHMALVVTPGEVVRPRGWKA